MTDARSRLLRDTRGSGVPEGELLMPEQWPVLVGDLCILRVLDESDAADWRPEEDLDQLVDHAEVYGDQQLPSRLPVEYCIRARRVAWACGGGLRHFGVWIRPSDELAGGVQLRLGPATNEGEAAADLTWVLWRELKSAALAAEAVRLSARWAQDTVTGLVVANPHHEDAAAQAVLEAAGFRSSGPRRHRHLPFPDASFVRYEFGR